MRVLSLIILYVILLINSSPLIILFGSADLVSKSFQVKLTEVTLLIVIIILLIMVESSEAANEVAIGQLRKVVDELRKEN